MGVIHELMLAVVAVKSLRNDKELMNAIEKTVLYFEKVIGDLGYLPRYAGAKNYTVDFCQGSPGAIPTLTLAAELFPARAPQLLGAAEKAGEVTWQ